MAWQPSGSLMAVFTAVFMGTMSSMEKSNLTELFGCIGDPTGQLKYNIDS